METINTLGQILDDGAKRDAIHIALAPLLAAERLAPGAHVGTDGHGRVSKSGPHIGIVDPFLTAPVNAGMKVWVMLYPNTITGLRHEWTHPALDESEAERQTARESLAEYASREGLRFEELMSGLNYGYGEGNGEVCFPSGHNYAIKEEEAPDVWRAYCLYTRKPMPSHDIVERTTFRCAC